MATTTDLQEYLETLSNSEQKLLKDFINCLDSVGAIESYHASLQSLLIAKPYPVLQILSPYYLKEIISVGRIILAALNQLLHENDDDSTPSFINFLTNCPSQVLTIKTVKDKLLFRLLRCPFQDKVYLALLARKDSQLLTAYNTKLQQSYQISREANELNASYVLHQALTQQKHFVPLVCKQIKNFASISDSGIRNNLLILKIAQEFGTGSQTLDHVGCLNKMLTAFDADAAPQQLRAVHHFFYADFERLNIILEFLNSFDVFKTIKVEFLLKCTSVLEILYEHGIETSYDDAFCLIERVYSWRKQTPELTCIREQELEMLAYYKSLCLIYSLIDSDDKEQFYTRSIQQLHTYIRQIRSFEKLCALIEDIFQLVFLRWEQVQSSRNDKLKGRGHNCMSSTDDDNFEDDRPPEAHSILSTVTSTSFKTRIGFICRSRALHSIFTFLKNFVTKKMHTEGYKHATQDLHSRFQRIIDAINEAMWKHSVMEKIDKAMQRVGNDIVPQCLKSVEVLNFVKVHNEGRDKTSSDDDSGHTNLLNLTRRKKRRRATFCGETLMGSSRADSSKMVNSVSGAQEKYGSNTLAQLKLTTLHTERTIIPRMLGSPENLAIMALALKNLYDVKYIIETFHLENTALNQELHFVEQQQQVKQKLITIYINYCQQDTISTSSDSSSTPLPTVEQIKNVAAKGFDMSKIINIVDNFAQAQRMHQSDDLKQMLQKLAKGQQYSFLQHFEERNLNAIIICDLIINLPFNREISTNLLMLIRRQQHHCPNPNNQTKTANSNSMQAPMEKSQLPRELGAMMLLEQLCECMRLLEVNNGKKLALNELLYCNYYSLKPHKLTLELQREAAFNVVYSITPSEFAYCKDLKFHHPLFQQLKSKFNYYARLCNYVSHLTRLLQLRDANLEYHCSELMEKDPCGIIGDLIYVCNMPLLELEIKVSALNLNLVHVIAMNICPELVNRQPLKKQHAITSQKQESIHKYIKQHNKLLAYLLQAVQDPAWIMNDDVNMQSVYLRRLLALMPIESLRHIYNGKNLVAALRFPFVNMQTLEDQVQDKQIRLKVLLNECGIKASKKVQHNEIDKLILLLIKNDAKNITLVVHMHDIALRANLLQRHFTKIATTRLAKGLIERTLQHEQARQCIPLTLRLELEKTLADITTYAKVSEVLQFESWPQAYDFGYKTPNAIFTQLLQMQRYKLCYEWCQVVQLGEHFTTAQHHKFLAPLLDALLLIDDEQVDCAEADGSLLQILEIFSHETRYEFLDAHKDKFRAFSLVKYSVEFLKRNARNLFDYRNYELSLAIFEQLTISERRPYWGLLRFPLLIIEQLIMNSKFELLGKVLQAVRDALKQPVDKLCAYCFDKRGNIYDIHTKGSAHKQLFKLGHHDTTASSASSAFILLNFNLYQKDHIISNECVDLLLRIYATKALDYHIADTTSSSSEHCSQMTDMQLSLDSLYGAFQLPTHAPHREDWVRDDEATHCMCCRRAAFTMLMRRHHCRRCGRVVCYACSTHQMLIPELYAEVEVRICNDCHQRCSVERENPKVKNNESNERRHMERTVTRQSSLDDGYKWYLSGNITHDKLLREEFCYEHAPSVALSLSILDYHLGRQKYLELLLYHCRKLEKLIVPNPEVDYELVAKMMNCLALAAKVRGAPVEFESILEHAEIIMSVVQHDCESLIPPGPLGNHSLRKLADALVQAEHWQLALEVHLKCGFPTAGVMAAHGLACLRAGCYETAREKFTHCMSKLTSEQTNSSICKQLFNSAYTVVASSIYDNDNVATELPIIKRPQRGPPLLQEILKLISAIPHTTPQPETLQRASLIRNSNSSLASFFSRRKEPFVFTTPLHEPALNILNTLANLKHIAKGHYTEGCFAKEQSVKYVLTRTFEEAMHYVLTFGSHTDVLHYLMKQDEIIAALKYFQLQQLEPELFIQNIFLPTLRSGQLPMLMDQLQLLDDGQLTLWRLSLIHTCRFLEQHQHLNSLYQLQLLLKDPIRASMTCVRFYSMHCSNFQQLHANAQHLRNAQMHLQTELEQALWDKNINLETSQHRRRSSSNSSSTSRREIMTASNKVAGGFLMQMDARALNGHINTILRQLDVAKFLAQCEQLHEADMLITEKILKQIRFDIPCPQLPTLFEGVQAKIQLCILILLCGKNIDEGFGLAYRIIQEYKLTPMKIFGATAKYLACNHRLYEVEKLLNCITTNNGTSTRDVDELLSIAINSTSNSHEPMVKETLDNLAKKINNIELRITSHMFIGQLKSAYLLANKYERMGDIRKILRQAELTNQIHIKKLCEKKLNSDAKPSTVQAL